jgi:quinolinate synthase
MKMTTLDKIARSLREGTHSIEVDPVVAARARRSVERMVAIGNPGAGE